jgi:hypothetical protein
MNRSIINRMINMQPDQQHRAATTQYPGWLVVHVGLTAVCDAYLFSLGQMFIYMRVRIAMVDMTCKECAARWPS